MKHNLILFSLLLILCFGGLASGKESRYKNLFEVASWSQSTAATTTPKAPGKSDYPNLADSSRWSKLLVGKALTAKLHKRAHGSQFQEPSPDEMFAIGHGSGECNWTCCFKSCMNSAMSGAGQTCLYSCTSCGLTPGPFACAVCAACSVVGIAAVEFCGLHCCVNPGC